MFACEISNNMLRRLVRITGVLGILLIVCFVLSARTDAQIEKTVEEPYAPPSDQALLVLARPRHRQASETDFRVVNQAGRCIALLENGWQVAAPLWPGKHMLLVLTGTAPPTVQLMQVNVSAGKTYVVKLRARVNVKSPVEIEILRKSDQPLEQFPSSIKEQSPFKQDLRKCTEWVSWKRSKIEPKAEVAKGKWDDADDKFRSEHTVHRKDGWTAAEVAGK
jgi:hypothetical protein